MNKKPELLIPAGNIESFHAAIEGGADAIFLGMKQFNARGRAVNFSNPQLITMIKTAHDKGVKIYVTLNIVIKNSEIKELLDTLNFLSQVGVDAIIIQDWGVWYIAHKFFPSLVIHASTQMANHNSIGANFSQKHGIERVIMARELTMPELKLIMKHTNVEIEIFVHGALCYSFSGLCLFSSYLGGKGANRGQCTQPCRRIFEDKKTNHAIFSLKDNQQIEQVDEFKKIGIASLKIEGRMKSAAYVYQVAQSYRKAIDDTNKTNESLDMLSWDFGREKTSYFLGGNVQNSISEKTNNGIFLGKVKSIKDDGFILYTKEKIIIGSQLRVVNNIGGSINVKFKEYKEHENGYHIITNKKVMKGNDVYLLGLPSKSFANKFSNLHHIKINTLNGKIKQKIHNDLKIKNSKRIKNKFFVRIDNLLWMRKLRIDEFDGIFLDIPLKEYDKLPLDSPFFKKNINRFHIELPGFISEQKIEDYKRMFNKLRKKGISNFVISHLSQLDILPKKVNVISNERVYAYNDAAIRCYKNMGVSDFIYPVENDFENLKRGSSRDGIMIMYSNPQLFYARMPVKVYDDNSEFKDNTNNTFVRKVKEGITTVYSKMPAALFQYSKTLSNEGFFKFMFDLRTEQPSKHLPNKLFKKFKASEQLQPSMTFNFKRGLS